MCALYISYIVNSQNDLIGSTYAHRTNYSRDISTLGCKSNLIVEFQRMERAFVCIIDFEARWKTRLLTDGSSTKNHNVFA